MREKNRGVRPKGGVAMMAIRGGAKLMPIYIGTKKRLFAPGSHYIRKAVCTGIYRTEGYGGGVSGQRRQGDAAGLCAGRRSMDVKVAESAGFCYGVKRAVDMARETARQGKPCVMLGSIIHNANVVEELETLGMRRRWTRGRRYAPTRP